MVAAEKVYKLITLKLEMESVLKKINAGKFDDDVHSEFVKYSKGVFGSKYVLEAKKQKDRYSIKTGAEFANFLVRSCLEKVSGKVKVSGIIVSTFDVKKDIDFPIEKVKQFMGIKQLVINCEIEAKKMISLMDKYPRAFFALSFSTPDCDLKIKAKAPKSAKPASTGDKEPKAGFCSIKTSDRNIIGDLFFDFPNFSEIRISHILNIKEIILPKGESEPAKIRELAKRKGTITRKVNADGKESVREMPFEA